MEFIRVKKDDGAVTLRILIDGVLEWAYEYVSGGGANQFIYTGNSHDGKTHVYSLGQPHEVHMEDDSWDVKLANPGDQAAACTVTITWEQKGKPIHSWRQNELLDPGSAKVLSANSFMVVVP